MNKKIQDIPYNFRSNGKVNSELKKVAAFYGLNCSEYIRMAILRDAENIASLE